MPKRAHFVVQVPTPAILWLFTLAILMSGCTFVLPSTGAGFQGPPNGQIKAQLAVPTGLEPIDHIVLSGTNAGLLLYESTVIIPTYPYERYQTEAVDLATGWPYKVFDRERYLADNPEPENKTYRSVVLENEYLILTILPQLGGRLWQVLHKPSGNQLFYQNDVVKPSPWGPANQLGWLALGGLEWGVPVIEHGYDWGTEWAAELSQQGPDVATVTLSTPNDDRLLNAQIAITLRAGVASFDIQPTLVNKSSDPLQFDYWHTALLAPGPENSPSPDLRFVMPTYEVTVHSTGDPGLPLPQQPMTWPRYAARDMSRLGNWNQYVGLFEYPSARGPFVGVYDRAYDAGGVRIYPARTARGSKLFGLGWQDALSSDYFTDDGTAYVELHGGLAPSFFEQAALAGNDSITWRETWYPLQGIHDLSYANELAAISVAYTDSVLTVGLYPVLPLEGTLVVERKGIELFRQPVTASPDSPQTSVLTNIPKAASEYLDIRLLDSFDRELMHYQFR